MADETMRRTLVMCGVDGSDHAESAIVMAAELAQATQAPLAVVAVNQLTPASGHPDIRDWTTDQAEALLMAATRTARRHGVDAQPVLTEGRDVAAALLDSASRLRAGHIVVGAGEARGMADWLLGSVARTVAARAPCSVTIAR